MMHLSDSPSVRRAARRAAAFTLVAATLTLPMAGVSDTRAATRVECGRISLPRGYTARVNVEGASCRAARVAVRDNLAKRIRRQTGGTGITRKQGWRCTPAHGDEAVCYRRGAVAFGYDISS